VGRVLCFDVTAPEVECVYCFGSPVRHERFAAYEDDDVVIFPAPEQAATNPGFSMLVPKRHVQDLHQLPDDLLGAVTGGLRLAGPAIRSAFHDDGLDDPVARWAA
jgi:diadenosine tetraphosphate (Ap4A) HIT family hydrolase